MYAHFASQCCMSHVLPPTPLPNSMCKTTSVGGGRPTTPPCVRRGRGLGHPGSIFQRLWEGADRPGRAKRPKVGRAVTAITLAFISFHFGCVEPSFPFIFVFWAFMSSHFGFWAFILALGLISFLLIFWAFISFHFGLLGLHFLSFWHFGPSFPFILAFWALISFHFGILGLHFLSFWLFWAFMSVHFLIFRAGSWVLLYSSLLFSYSIIVDSAISFVYRKFLI